MAVSDFWQKLLDASDNDGLPPYDPMRPSDINIPVSMGEKAYAMILDVPTPIGALVRDLVLLSKKYTKEEGKDDWIAMPYRDNPALVDYVRDVNWFNGIVTIVDPPNLGRYVCLTNTGVEKLVEHFPSDKYKQKKWRQKT